MRLDFFAENSREGDTSGMPGPQTQTPPDGRQRLFPALALLALLIGLLLPAGQRLGPFLEYSEREAACALTRTDLPGYEAYPALADPLNSMAAANHCAEACPVTLVDEQGRAWRLSAEGYCLQWDYTSTAGALVAAKNLRTGETVSFWLGSPDHVPGEFPVPVQDGLTADVLPRIKQVFGLPWQFPSFDKGRFRQFITRTLRVEAIPGQEVGQTVAFGNGMDLRQTADFNPAGIYLSGGRGSVCPRLILMEKPAYLSGPTRTASYTTAAGLQATLLWSEYAGDSPVERGVSLFADFGSRGVVQVMLDPCYMAAQGIATADQALAHARAQLDRLTPVGTPG